MFSDVFGMGITEILLIGAVALMLFSPKELPGIIKWLARFYGSLRRTADDFRSQIMETDELREIRGEFHRTRAEVRDAKAAAQREINRAKLEALRSRDEVKTTVRDGKKAVEQRVRSDFQEASEEASEPASEPARDPGTQGDSPPRPVHGQPVTAAPRDPERERADQGAA